MRLSAITAVKENTLQFLFYQTLYSIADVVTWSYYMILLLRASNNDISTVFLNSAGYITGIPLGFFICSMFINRLGYRNTFRLSNWLLIACTVLTLITLPQILELHMLLAILRGISKAFFFTPANMYNLKEVRGGGRTNLLNITIALNQVISIALPVVVGGAIVAYGYDWIFLVGIALYFIGAIYPWKLNKHPRDGFNMSELLPLFRHRGFKRWTALLIVTEFLNQSQALAFAVIPFLFLGNEFEVGALTSLFGFIAAGMVFVHRNDKLKKRFRYALASGSFITVINLIFGVVWTLPSLILRGALVTAGGAFIDPSNQEFGYVNKELILGSFLSETTVEIDLFLEVIYYIGRITATLALVLLLVEFHIDQSGVLRGIIFMTAAVPLIMLFGNIGVNRLIRKGSRQPLPPSSLSPALRANSI